MKKSQLRKIIREEINKLTESDDFNKYQEIIKYKDIKLSGELC
jgi:hypothetical protein